MGLDLTLLPSEDTALGKALVGFWRWWTEGLRKALPHRRRGAGDAFVVELAPGRLRLPEDGSEQPWGADRGLDPVFLEQIRERRGGHPLVIRLDEELALIKRLRLPALARDELDAAVGYQLASATPFPPERLYHGYRVLSREGGALEVELIAVPKDSVRPLLDALATGGLGAPARLAVAGRDDVDLLPRQRAVSGARWRRIGWRLPALLLLLFLLGVLMVVPVVKKRAEVIRLNTELAVVKKRAAPLLKAKEKAMKLQRSLRELAAPAEQRFRELEIIDRLSALLPDSVWLIELRIDGDRIQLRGEARHAVDVLERLQNAPEFTDARFLSPVSKNRRSGRENFHIEIRAVTT